jgi:hypothetical protein
MVSEYFISACRNLSIEQEKPDVYARNEIFQITLSYTNNVLFCFGECILKLKKDLLRKQQIIV